VLPAVVVKKGPKQKEEKEEVVQKEIKYEFVQVNDKETLVP
jgi:hypothetical protein